MHVFVMQQAAQGDSYLNMTSEFGFVFQVVEASVRYDDVCLPGGSHKEQEQTLLQVTQLSCNFSAPSMLQFKICMTHVG